MHQAHTCPYHSSLGQSPKSVQQLLLGEAPPPQHGCQGKPRPRVRPRPRPNAPIPCQVQHILLLQLLQVLLQVLLQPLAPLLLLRHLLLQLLLLLPLLLTLPQVLQLPLHIRCHPGQVRVGIQPVLQQLPTLLPGHMLLLGPGPCSSSCSNCCICSSCCISPGHLLLLLLGHGHLLLLLLDGLLPLLCKVGILLGLPPVLHAPGWCGRRGAATSRGARRTW